MLRMRDPSWCSTVEGDGTNAVPSAEPMVLRRHFGTWSRLGRNHDAGIIERLFYGRIAREQLPRCLSALPLMQSRDNWRWQIAVAERAAEMEL